MTDAMRSSFENDYPHAKQLEFNPTINKYEFVEDDGARWTHAINREWRAYQKAWQASRQQPIRLPNPTSGHYSGIRSIGYDMTVEAIKAAGYTVE